MDPQSGFDLHLTNEYCTFFLAFTQPFEFSLLRILCLCLLAILNWIMYFIDI